MRDLSSAKLQESALCCCSDAGNVSKFATFKIPNQTVDNKVVANEALEKNHCHTVGKFPVDNHEKLEFALIIVDD